MLLETEAIIAFKAKAWLDLSKKKENGIHVDTSDINKHKNDIARLAMILEGRSIQFLPEEVKKDMETFLAFYEKEPADLKSLRIKDATNEDVVERLKTVFLG